MAAIPFKRDLAFEYATIETLSPLVRRVVARNPGPYTAQGTATYIIGHGHVAIIDPGPDLPAHIAVLLDSLRGESIDHLVITHTHTDHSPAAAALKRATGAKTYGFGPHGSGHAGSGSHAESSEEGGDTGFVPDQRMMDGDALTGPGWRLSAIHTPGHCSNHLCFALEEERTLFTGDHVMGWSTSVIVPPDGDMAAYRLSLNKLLSRDDLLYRPTHGPAITEPKPYVSALIQHRAERGAAILERLAAGDRTIGQLVAALYIGLAPVLVGAASRSVLAHLIEFCKDGQVVCDGAPSLEATYRRP